MVLKVKCEVIGLACSGDPYVCPVKSIGDVSLQSVMRWPSLAHKSVPIALGLPEPLPSFLAKLIRMLFDALADGVQMKCYATYMAKQLLSCTITHGGCFALRTTP
eukprot:scaffold67026_cov21-Cyclotella_meneghiniana.AAC.2